MHPRCNEISFRHVLDSRTLESTALQTQRLLLSLHILALCQQCGPWLHTSSTPAAAAVEQGAKQNMSAAGKTSVRLLEPQQKQALAEADIMHACLSDAIFDALLALGSHLFLRMYQVVPPMTAAPPTPPTTPPTMAGTLGPVVGAWVILAVTPVMPLAFIHVVLNRLWGL